jgi:hypothetical protein
VPRRHLHHGALIVAIASLVGCEARQPGPLIDHDTWEVLEPGSDPLAAHRPPGAECPLTEYIVENGALEVQTGVCSYFSVHQPSLKIVSEGGPVHLVMWHSTLDAAEPGEAHVAVLFGDDVAWEQTVEIPSPPRVYEPVIEAPAVALDEPVSVHLHNHGDNAWTFLTIEIPEP